MDKDNSKNDSLMTFEEIEKKIYLIRGQKIMLDSDLAEVYGVTTKRLNEQVRRNKNRFPEDFMFQFTKEEYLNFVNRSQIATGSQKHRDPKFPPYVFTEHGAVMLASILNSPAAIEASLQVVRAFVRLRTILAEHKELAAKIEELEKKMDDKFAVQDEKIISILKIIKQFIETPATGRKQIGYINKK